MNRKGFTFIETIIVVALMSVMFGSGFVYFSNFSTRQDLDKARNKLANQVKIARSYARAGIIPEGQENTDLFKYVKLEVDSEGNVVITSDIGNTYSSTPAVGRDMELSVSLTGCGLCFSAGNGKLVDDAGGAVGVGDSVAVSIVSKKDSSDYKSIVINSSGSVDEIEGLVLPTSTPTPAPLPTSTPALIICGGTCMLPDGEPLCTMLGGSMIDGTNCVSPLICCQL